MCCARPSGCDPQTAVVMITAYGSERIAVEAMKHGAEDYVPKPFDNDEIRLVVARALGRTRLERENRLLLAQAPAPSRVREPGRLRRSHAARLRDAPEGRPRPI